MKRRAGQGPDDDDQDRDDKGPGATKNARGFTRENAEGVPNLAKKIPFIFLGGSLMMVAFGLGDT